MQIQIFSRPDCTVGFGITPNLLLLTGLWKKFSNYRRWGLSPRHEDTFYQLYHLYGICQCFYLPIDFIENLCYNTSNIIIG